MPDITQEGRIIAIDTPLGADVLLLRSFTGVERMSRMFRFHLDMLSRNFNISFDDIVGKNVTITVQLADGSERYLNGHIALWSAFLLLAGVINPAARAGVVMLPSSRTRPASKRVNPFLKPMVVLLVIDHRNSCRAWDMNC